MLSLLQVFVHVRYFLNLFFVKNILSQSQQVYTVFDFACSLVCWLVFVLFYEACFFSFVPHRLVLRKCFSRNNYIHKTLTRRSDVPHEAGFKGDMRGRCISLERMNFFIIPGHELQAIKSAESERYIVSFVLFLWVHPSICKKTSPWNTCEWRLNHWTSKVLARKLVYLTWADTKSVINS